MLRKIPGLCVLGLGPSVASALRREVAPGIWLQGEVTEARVELR